MKNQINFIPNIIGLISTDWKSKKDPLETIINGKNRNIIHVFFKEIIDVCNNHNCDTLLFAFNLDHNNTPQIFQKDQIFPIGTNHKFIIMGEKSNINSAKIHIWYRDNDNPIFLERFINLATDVDKKKIEFLNNFNTRVFGPSFIIFGGELNIIKMVQNKRPIDQNNFISKIKEEKIKFFINPMSDYMRRWQMKIKQSFLSNNKRFLISVWNRGTTYGVETKFPWRVFYNGKDVTEVVKEISNPIAAENKIRIGIFNVKKFTENLQFRLFWKKNFY